MNYKIDSLTGRSAVYNNNERVAEMQVKSYRGINGYTYISTYKGRQNVSNDTHLFSKIFVMSYIHYHMQIGSI